MDLSLIGIDLATSGFTFRAVFLHGTGSAPPLRKLVFLF
jgi:hypothetical protein